MDFQTTIGDSFTLAGAGLHTGKITHATVTPAEAGRGITFVRTDLDDEPEVAATADNVVATDHGTTIGVGGVCVSTIEHLMSALHGMRVDNAVVKVDGPEVPILDGSARLWVEQIRRAGVKTLEAERRYYRVGKRVEWNDGGDVSIVAEPADGFVVECNIRFKSDLIGAQSATLTSYGEYEKDIAVCRTFVFLHEVEMLLAHNLIKGGDLDNALVFADRPLGDAEKARLGALFGKEASSISVENGVLNTVKPYFVNEPARHKLLDFMGDVYLAGMPLKGRFVLTCPGHKANTEFAKVLLRHIREENA